MTSPNPDHLSKALPLNDTLTFVIMVSTYKSGVGGLKRSVHNNQQLILADVTSSSLSWHLILIWITGLPLGDSRVSGSPSDQVTYDSGCE